MLIILLLGREINSAEMPLERPVTALSVEDRLDTQVFIKYGVLLPEGDIKQYALWQVIDTWDSSQWSSFDYVVRKESNWDHTAVNPSSGACGLPQSLPCSKMGTDDPYEQIDWMIWYIQESYGTPKRTKIFHLQNNWY